MIRIQTHGSKVNQDPAKKRLVTGGRRLREAKKVLKSLRLRLGEAQANLTLWEGWRLFWDTDVKQAEILCLLPDSCILILFLNIISTSCLFSSVL